MFRSEAETPGAGGASAERRQTVYGSVNREVGSIQMQQTLLSSFVPASTDARPDATAVICDDESLTWNLFEGRVGRLAATLMAEGVKAGDRVGIYLHKSIESMVAVHGILRAGAAYVPIDPLAPIDLIESIIADCGIETLVTHQLRTSGLTRLLPKLAPTTVIGVDGGQLDPPSVASGSTAAPAGSPRAVLLAATSTPALTLVSPA